MKRRKRKFTTQMPQNYSFWKRVLGNQEETEMFLTRSTQCRLVELGQVVVFLKKSNIDFYNKIGGGKILKRIYN